MEELDEKDQFILQKLKEDGRISYGNIAKELNLSESTVRKRVNRLIEENIIERFTIVLNPKKSGKKILSFITLVPSTQSNIKDLIDNILKLPEITEAFYMSGKCGLLLKCEVRNLKNLDELIEQIRELREISEIENCIVIRTLKRSF